MELQITGLKGSDCKSSPADVHTNYLKATTSTLEEYESHEPQHGVFLPYQSLK
jgi:hypothetical protein